MIKTFTTNVFQKFKNIFKTKNSIIVQIRIEKIGFRNYLHHIEIKSSPKCFCEAVRQMIKHTLLNCFKHDAVQKKLLQINNKNLTKLLKTSALIIKIAKFLLITNELHQFRYIHAFVNFYERKTLVENN